MTTRQFWPRCLLVILAAGLLLPTARLQAEEPSGPLNLSQCIRLALAASPDLAPSHWSVETRRADLEMADSASLPRGELISFSGAVPDAHGNTTRADRSSSSLSQFGPFTRLETEITVPLFTWGKIAAGRKAAHSGLAQERDALEQKRLEVVRDVKEQYYNYVLAGTVGQILADAKKDFDEAIAKAEEKLRTEDPQVSRSDVLRLRIGEAEVAKELARVVQGRRIAGLALRRSTGIAPDADMVLADEFLKPETAVLASAGEYLSKLLAVSPQWKRLSDAIAAKRSELDGLKADFLPAAFLLVSGRYGYAPGRSRQTNPFVVDQFNFYSIGPSFGLRWPLDFAETAAKVSRTRAELGQLLAEREAARSGLEIELRRAHGDVEAAREALGVASRARKDSRALAILALTSFDVGVGEAKDVFEGVLSYTKEDTAYQETVRDYNLALARLSLVVGEEVTELRYGAPPP